MLELISSVIVAAITGLITFQIQAKRLRTELQTEFMAEQVVRRLLTRVDWTQRSFERIRDRFGGFEDDELRRILVRSGAVRFQDADDTELWGLMNRNLDKV